MVELGKSAKKLAGKPAVKPCDMQKKLFAPATLRRGKVWYIEWWESSAAGQWRRFRKTYSLNRVKDLSLRYKLGKHYVKEVNDYLVAKFLEGGTHADSLTFAEAVDLALSVKTRSDRDETNKVYRTAARHLRRVGKRENWLSMDVRQFSQRHAMIFSDDLIVNRKMANRGVNNVIRNVKTMFNALVEREIIVANPFRKWKPLPVGEKEHRIYSDEEMSLILRWLKENDRWMFRLILLQYYCYIRPRSEMLRLQVKDFDLAAGTIYIAADKTKSRRQSRLVTIPKLLLRELLELQEFPGNWLVFGRGLAPNAEPCHRNLPYSRYRKALLALKAAGMDITGMTLYQWKHTGITRHYEFLRDVDVQDQAGHTNIKQTAHYRAARRKANPAIRSLDDNPGGVL